MTGWRDPSRPIRWHSLRGIEALITNDGRMRLIVGLKLGPSEQEALTAGYDLRE
jgi:hypothetical protein